MNVAERRLEIINILIVRRHVTVKELAEEFNVTVRTIENDIQALSLAYPIYTKPGVAGGVFMSEHYNPYINSLTGKELQTLKELYRSVDDKYKKCFGRLSISTDLIRWKSKLVIPIKYIIITMPFIADGGVLMYFLG